MRRVLAAVVVGVLLVGCAEEKPGRSEIGTAPSAPGAPGSGAPAKKASGAKLPESVQSAPVKILPPDNEKQDVSVAVYTIPNKGQVTVTVAPGGASSFDELVGHLDDAVATTQGKCGLLKGSQLGCYQKLSDGLMSIAASSERLTPAELASFAAQVYERLA